MKKTLLIAAAALAAGVISSQAQGSVYSQNIVGYVNLPAPSGGYQLLSNPLDTTDGSGAVNNSATNVFVNIFDPVAGAGPLDGSQLLIYTGSSYVTYYFDSNPADTTTGFTDFAGHPLPAPNLAAGLGFYFNNQGLSNSVTVVGSVRGATSAGVSYTNTVGNASLYYLVGSAVPLAGDLQTNLSLSNPYDPIAGSGPLDGSQIQIPNYTSGHANIASYTTYYFDSNPADTTTGFTDFAGHPLPAPVISVGQAFFFSNQTGGNYKWIQAIGF